MKNVNILVDARPVNTRLGFTIMQACSNVGIDIPRFCYHDKLLIAGNCRICLVEVVGSKKLVASCAVHVADNMAVYTNTVRVRLARQNVLEFLLANHPLDCPICDQGGECDLQDITTLFGADRGRFYEAEKRAVLNKDFGPLIRTSMNRCIHCTRCVRFLAMASGVSILGTLGRGSATEIGTYVNQFIADELSGNITDLCPVGALTSKPFSFKARPWELVSVRSIDVFDSMNSSLLFDIVANKISRVLPYANDSLNECWLTNKARYAYDGLFLQRMDSCTISLKEAFLNSQPFGILNQDIPSFRVSVLNLRVKLGWDQAFSFFFSLLLNNDNVAFYVSAGPILDLETAFQLNFLASFFGGAVYLNDSLSFLNIYTADFNTLYLFNSSLNLLSKLPSFCFLVGTNLRLEAPLLNLRLTALFDLKATPIYKVGSSAVFSSYPIRQISSSILDFIAICEFKHPFCKNFYVPSFGYRPLILAASYLTYGKYSFLFSSVLIAFINRLLKICNKFSLITKWINFDSLSYFGFIYQYSGPLAAIDSGLASQFPRTLNFNFSSLLSNLTVFAPKFARPYSVIYTLASELNALSSKLINPHFLIYQGSHGTATASNAFLSFPTVTYVEKSSFFKNLIGLVQKTELAVKYDFGLKTDVEIFRSMLIFFLSHNSLSHRNFSYRGGVLLNTSLIVSKEKLLNSAFFSSTSLIKLREVFSTKSDVSFNATFLKLYSSFYYVIAHSYALMLSPLNQIAVNTNSSLMGKIFSNTLQSTTINYYGDGGVSLLTSSKTMSLCSNIALKKNFSFTTIYY